MFDMLKKYKNHGCFEFTLSDDLREVCNAPTDKSGVYIIFACLHDKKQLIYIGCSGKEKNGTIVHRKAGLGGIKDRIVNGHQFGKVPRKKSWPEQMRLHSIDSLCVYWFDTQNDDPVMIEHQLLAEYEGLNKELPVWNKRR